MGPYCNYCDKRCFVDNKRKPGHLLATCYHGQEHDKDILGYCYREIVEGLVKRKVSMTFDAIEGEDFDTMVVANLTKPQQDAVWKIIYAAEPVSIGNSRFSSRHSRGESLMPHTYSGMEETDA